MKKTAPLHLTVLVSCLFVALPGCEQPVSTESAPQRTTPATPQPAPQTAETVATPVTHVPVGVSMEVFKEMKAAAEDLATVNKASQIMYQPHGDDPLKGMQAAYQKLAKVLSEKLNAVKLVDCPADFKSAFDAVRQPMIGRLQSQAEKFGSMNPMTMMTPGDDFDSKIIAAKLQFKAICLKHGFAAQLGDLEDGVSQYDHAKGVEDAARQLGVLE